MIYIYDIIDYLSKPLIAFVFFFLLFLPMEKLFPAYKKQKTFRPHWFVDLFYFIGQFFLWIVIVYYLVSTINSFYFENVSYLYADYFRTLPILVQFAITILLSDLSIYWFHRWQHNNSFLWRFHKIHHSAEHLDWLASYREHPIDTFFTILVINFPSILLGLTNQSILAFIAFRGIWAIYIHSNIKFNIGPLKYIIGSPEIHHWHHFKDKNVGNYANLSPLLDILFGTHYCPNEFPKELGIEEEIEQNYFKQIVYPLLPRNILNKLKPKP